MAQDGEQLSPCAKEAEGKAKFKIQQLQLVKHLKQNNSQL